MQSTRTTTWIVTALMLMSACGCSRQETPGTTPVTVPKSPTQDPPVNQRMVLLAQLEGKDQPAKLHTLLQIVRDQSNPAARRDALNYLLGLERQAQPIAEPLTQLSLDETDLSVVHDIRQVLVAAQADVELYLLSAAQRASGMRLTRIVETLGMTRAATPETLSLLQRQLNSEETTLVIATCQALERIGPAAQSLLPDLIKIAQRPRQELSGKDTARAFRESRDTTTAALKAIAAIGADTSAVPVLISCLAMEPQIATIAAEALAQLGPAAQMALPALTQLLNRDDHGGHDVKTRMARDAASKALSAIQPNSN